MEFSGTAALSEGCDGAIVPDDGDACPIGAADAAASGAATCGAMGAIDGFTEASVTGAAIAAAEAVGTAVAGAAWALVTIAWGVIDAVWLPSPVGRSISDMTTAAPAVAPIAVATKTTRKVLTKLGAGARYPHSGLKLPAERIATSHHDFRRHPIASITCRT